jgi:hypothetical protein
MRWLVCIALLGACHAPSMPSNGESIDAPRGSSSPMLDATVSGSAMTPACGCEGQAGCAVWSNVYISWYGFDDNSCGGSTTGCADIAYPAPLDPAGLFGTPYPNAGNITHTAAKEAAGTFDDPITAAASADTDPADPTPANPRHTFASSGGVTLTPGTKIYNPLVHKYFIFEDSCIECGDEYACKLSPEDTDIGAAPSGCVPGTNLHIDFWMGPPIETNTAKLTACEDMSTVGHDWMGGGGDIIVNPPPDLPVIRDETLYTSSGTCWTKQPVTPTSCL